MTHPRFRVLGALALLVAAAPLHAQDPDFSWKGAIPSGKPLIVRNLNGEIRVEATSGSEAEIIATKRVRRGDPAQVRIALTRPSGNDGAVLVCAYFSDNTSCDEDGYRTRGDGRWNRDLEASVEFRIKLPAGARLVASDVNGGIAIEGATNTVDAETVNGSIRAYSTGGPIHAHTVNGSIDVSMGTSGTGDLSFETVNGSVTVRIPDLANADLRMSTVNGSVVTDFPVTVRGRLNPKHLEATLGNGGRRLELETVNGDVRLRKG